MALGMQPKVWVVIADGEHARVVVPKAVLHQFVTHIAFDSVNAHKLSHDLGSERLGRVHESASTTRHAIAVQTDPHLLAKHRFILEVAAQIDHHANADAFDQLVLVAPAHALHDLRAALGKTATAKMVGTETHDLVKVPDHDLMSHLAKWWIAPP